MRIVWLFVAGLLLAGSASAGVDPDSTCRNRAPACIVSAIGGAPAEHYAARGGRLVRLLGWSGFGPLRVVIEFRQAPGHAAELLIASATDGDRRWVQPLERGDWVAVLEAVKLYRARALHPPAGHALRQGYGIQTVCVSTDAPTYFAEIALNGRVERVTTGDKTTPDGCVDPMDDLTDTLMNVAARAIPGCQRLVQDYTSVRLQECARLGGDRLAAADIANRARVLDNYYCDRESAPPDITPLLAADARLAVDGAPAVSGASDVVKAFNGMICGKMDGMGLLSVDGDGGGGTVRGFVRESREVEGSAGRSIVYYRDAPVTQRWVKSADGQWRIVDWTIGTFGAEIKVEHS